MLSPALPPLLNADRCEGLPLRWVSTLLATGPKMVKPWTWWADSSRDQRIKGPLRGVLPGVVRCQLVPPGGVCAARPVPDGNFLPGAPVPPRSKIQGGTRTPAGAGGAAGLPRRPRWLRDAPDAGWQEAADACERRRSSRAAQRRAGAVGDAVGRRADARGGSRGGRRTRRSATAALGASAVADVRAFPLPAGAGVPPRGTAGDPGEHRVRAWCTPWGQHRAS
jgi:hypothetical protein